MGRPRKQTADWFPHYVGGSRKTIFVLENRWGNDGYAFWFKLLELLCQSDGHYYDCTKQADMDYLTALTKVPEEKAVEIITALTDRDKIDRELWEQRRIIWCQTLVDNLSMMYSKRTVSAPVKPFSEEFPNRKQPDNEVSGDGKTHSTVQYNTGTEQDNTPEDITPPKDDPPAPEKPAKGKPKKPKKPEVVKVKYADFVSLTEDEYGKLVATHGKEDTARLIEILNLYKGSTGKSYKSDYMTILNWVVDRLKEEKAKRGATNGANWGHTQPQQQPGGFKPSGGFKKDD